ncbi:MAG: dTDP-4-dehydrorhamnose 3,5-epimerase family protein [Nitrososphaerota archaeon]|nr:dTDP-4-dehydrorhamnose 3,5-epimerase family protein [Candidatus Bathyarchaeota archaeon]MDW8049363.1 dTDP-4-dehydrorhamnose 3,5-epimerase family protein [Nitrososphaerota archaeon]
MLEGIRTFELKKIPDERGFFCEILRQDWREFLGDEWIVQANLSYSYPGIVRAWHRHLRGQIDYFVVLRGAMKICAYDEETCELDEIVGSEHKIQVVRIPGNFWHGTKTLGNEPSLTLYFVTRLYNYKDPDEERRPWNDPLIVPKSVNGKTDDPRVGKTWDWNYPPHK